ncbi:class I SAM-dependent methyltransferase [candidate division KSB1 bacterium]|nr:class I SAM-dependent methyltransferase [candidate division KSB1 bacterium]
MFEKQNIDYYNLVRKDALSILPKDVSFSAVLDLGCGEGYTLEYVKSHFGVQKTIGVEIHPEAAQSARQRVDVVLNQSAETILDLPEQSIDLILCLDVLEHLYDPWQTLQRIKKVLKPGGRLLASIPNIQHWRIIKMLMCGRWDYEKSGLLDETHLRFFTKLTARELIANAGFEIEWVQVSMGIKARIVNVLTLALLENFLTYHVYILAYLTRV